MSVDLKHGFIHNIATGTASEHDGHHFEEVLDEHNTGRDVYADKAYPSRRRQEMLKVLDRAICVCKGCICSVVGGMSGY